MLSRAPTIDNNVEASALQARLSQEELALFGAAAEAAARHDAWRAGAETSAARLTRAASLKRKWSASQENQAPNADAGEPGR